MELTGTFAGLSEDLINGTARIEFNIQERGAAVKVLPRLKDKMLRITVKPYRKKRSLDANAYYHVLIGKMADMLNISHARIHNMMLRRYGKIAILDGRPMYLSLKDTEAVREAVIEAEGYHLYPTSEIRQGKDGTPWRTYMMLKGSHEFDTKEMSSLIDGVVSDAQEMGIETMTPDELERMKAAWKA